MKQHNYIFGLSLLCSQMIGAVGTADLAQMLSDQQLLRSGQQLFQQNCIGCHGVDAKGKGPAAAMLNPKPRNLVEGSFKFRSTPLGSLPTTEDLIRTIDQGIANSSMPHFRFLAPQQKLALAMYIKSLRPDWSEWEESPYSFPSVPKEMFQSKAALMASAFEGEKLYMAACHTCHGDNGVGNGPNSAGLTDSDGNPLRPANLGLPSIKSGPAAEDVFKAIYTGLDGTPMPAFVDVYKPEQIWNLVAYVFYLRGRHSGVYTEEDKLVARSSVKKESAKGASSQEESWD